MKNLIQTISVAIGFLALGLITSLVINKLVAIVAEALGALS